MAPLGRALLALACAALLRAAHATYDPDQCTTITIGKDNTHIVYTRKLGPKRVHDGEIDISVLKKLGVQLAYEVVTVCADVGLAPIVTPAQENRINIQADSWATVGSPKLTMTVVQYYKPERGIALGGNDNHFYNS